MSAPELKHRIPIIIPVYNQVEYTKKAAASLLACTDESLFECLFVDNGSTDETPQYLAQLVRDKPHLFRSIRFEKNLGFGGGVNRGLELLDSFEWEYGAIANNDLLFTPKWLEQMLETHRACPIEKIGIVGPLSNMAGGSQGIQVSYHNVQELNKFATMHHELNKGTWHEAGTVVGLLMLFTRRFFKDVGSFDERFFPGTWEEVDWELRGAALGYRYIVDRSTFVHHYGSKTLAAAVDQRKNFVDNRRRLREKWRSSDSPWEQLARERHKLRGADPEAMRLPDGRYKKWVVAACRTRNGGRYIGKALERMSQIADEIVVLVDHSTTDDTREICARYPKVMEIGTEPPHEQNEAFGRNMLLDMAYRRHPDWVQIYDDDEVWENRAISQRESLTDPEDPTICLWVQPIIQLWNSENSQRVDGLWGTFYQGRMFRVLPGRKIDNPDNALHSGSHPYIPPDRHGFSYLRIVHYGNLDPEVRAKKYERYTEIDPNKNLDQVLGHWKDYYWRLYYGQPGQQEQANFDGKWRVLPNDPNWRRPQYGAFHERDVYRHVTDETGLILVPFSETPILSLIMLAHNEAGYLPKAVSSVRAFIHELIVVVDSRSTDGTDSVAEQLGAQVHFFDWKHDFSAARNFALSKANGNWILRIDPDESVPWDTAVKLPGLTRDESIEGCVFPIQNWLEDPSKPGAVWALSETCRLFRNLYPKFYYKGLVHEELDDSFEAVSAERKEALRKVGASEEEIKERGRVRIAKIPWSIHHFGYLRGREFLDRKFEYYYQLSGQQKARTNGKDHRPHLSMAVHEMHCHKYLDAVESYKKALELDPKNHFAMNDVGAIYFTVLGDYGKAEELFRKALESMDSNTHEEHRRKVERNLEEVRIRLLSKFLKV